MRDFISRFNAKAIFILCLQQDVPVLALMAGLKEGSAFRSYLGRKIFTSPGLVLGKENDFIRGEEFDKAASNHHRELEQKKKEK